MGWKQFKIAAIGHITEEHYKIIGATVHIKPKTYTMKAVIEEFAEGRNYNHDRIKLYNDIVVYVNQLAMRAMVKETYLHKEDLIYPIFVIEGENIKNEVTSMPGVFQFSLTDLGEEVDEVVDLGIPCGYFIRYSC